MPKYSECVLPLFVVWYFQMQALKLSQELNFKMISFRGEYNAKMTTSCKVEQLIVKPQKWAIE